MSDTNIVGLIGAFVLGMAVSLTFFRWQRWWLFKDGTASLASQVGVALLSGVVFTLVGWMGVSLLGLPNTIFGVLSLPVGIIIGLVIASFLPGEGLNPLVRFGGGLLVGALVFGGCTRLFLVAGPTTELPATPTDLPPTTASATPEPQSATAVPVTLVPTLDPLSGSATGRVILQLVGDGDPCGFAGGIFEYGATAQDGEIEIEQDGTGQKLTGLYLPDEKLMFLVGEANGFKEEVEVEVEPAGSSTDSLMLKLEEQLRQTEMRIVAQLLGEYTLTDPAGIPCVALDRGICFRRMKLALSESAFL